MASKVFSPSPSSSSSSSSSSKMVTSPAPKKNVSHQEEKPASLVTTPPVGARVLQTQYLQTQKLPPPLSLRFYHEDNIQVAVVYSIAGDLKSLRYGALVRTEKFKNWRNIMAAAAYYRYLVKPIVVTEALPLKRRKNESSEGFQSRLRKWDLKAELIFLNIIAFGVRPDLFDGYPQSTVFDIRRSANLGISRATLDRFAAWSEETVSLPLDIPTDFLDRIAALNMSCTDSIFHLHLLLTDKIEISFNGPVDAFLNNDLPFPFPPPVRGFLSRFREYRVTIGRDGKGDLRFSVVPNRDALVSGSALEATLTGKDKFFKFLRRAIRVHGQAEGTKAASPQIGSFSFPFNGNGGNIADMLAQLIG